MLCATFAGHRSPLLPGVERKLETVLEWLLEKDDQLLFYVGGMGEFDECCAASVRAAKSRHGEKKIQIILVLPYMTNKLNTDRIYYESSYDDVMIPFELSEAHWKAAIRKRNRWMVDRSNFLIAYVYRDFGGAYDTICYARRKGVPVINLAQQGQLLG